MRNKKLAWSVAALIIILGLLMNNVLSRQKEPMRQRPSFTKANPIKIITVKNQDITSEIMMTGPLYAYDKIELYAEVSGVLLNTPKRFKEGIRYFKGDVLLHIDDRVYKNNVLAQKSNLLNQITLLLPDLSIDFPESENRWNGFLNIFDLEQPLDSLPETSSSQERYYIASRNIYSQYYSIKAMEETLDKYTLRAPFSGVVTVSNINPGTLVRIGQKLGEFTSTGLLEMEAAVGVQEVKRLVIGQNVILKSEMIPGTFHGKIQRINPVIDRSTMTMKIYVNTQDSRLTEGMYMTARVQALPIEDVFAVQRDLLDGQDQLFTVEDSILTLRKVVVVANEGERAFVQGLVDGTTLLGEVWTEAKEGIRLPDFSSNGSGMQGRKVSDKKNMDGGGGKR